jgi:hypothetical protein
MNDFLENLKRQAAENPVAALGVAAVLITAISRLVDANSAARNSQSWAKEVRRRSRSTK